MAIDLGGVKLVDRPRMFRAIERVVTDKLLKRFWVRGGVNQVGGYQWPANRRRIRQLARQMARDEMRTVRRKAMMKLKGAGDGE
jgi:hypothetical protein